MATYPEEGKPTHPDDVGKRRMPVRQTKVADTEENPNIVKYGASNKDWSSAWQTKDLGKALKGIKLLREAHPDKDLKLDAE